MSDGYEEVEFELDPVTLETLQRIADDQSMTFDELVNEILREEINKLKVEQEVGKCPTWLT